MSDSNFDINKLTLQLMVSTNKYKKYLAKQDPALLEEIERKGRDLSHYKSRIKNLAHDLISYIEKDAEDRVAPADSTTELLEIMDRFVNVALAHIKTLDETKIDESGNDHNNDQINDEISDNDNDNDNDANTNESNTDSYSYVPVAIKSAWGPTLHRYGYTPKK